MTKVRVWYDYKRGCYASNAAFVLAAMTGIQPMQAAQLLKLWFDRIACG